MAFTSLMSPTATKAGACDQGGGLTTKATGGEIRWPLSVSPMRGRADYRTPSISRTSVLLGWAPATDVTGSPPLNTVSVGTDITR